VALGGNRQRALLALLLVHAGEALPADRLIHELWGEDAPLTAPRMLHVQVSRLRKALAGGGKALATREHGYVLDVGADELDARRFEALLERGGRELVAGRPAPAAELLERGLGLWRGAPLADLAYERFAQAEIGRLEELRISAQEQLADAHLELGRHADVAGRLPPLIREHPYRERLRCQLMLALYRCDRQADALQAYQDARRALVEDLGIEPGERLRLLEQAVLAHDPALAAPARPSPAPPTPSPVPAMPPVRAADARRTVTVAVADLADAAALAEQLDPESVHAVMERLTSLCATVLAAHGAETDDGVGDAVVGVFGLRARHEDDPLRAVRAGLELRDACAALAAELAREYGAEPAVGIGIASGEVFARAGARPRGEAMHVAAALAAAATGDAVLAGEDTRALAGPRVRGEPAEPVAVRGRSAPIAAWRVDALAPEPPAPTDGPFVGRQPELAALRAAQRATADDASCRRLIVVGAAGVGKSRLVRELLRGLGEAVGVARCRASGDAGAASATADLVRDLLGADPEAWIRARLVGDERVDAIVRRTLVALGRADEPAQPGEIAWAVRRVLEAAAAERPLVVVVEDAHNADPALLDLVEYVLAFAGAAAILLLCLGRPELLEQRPAWAAPRPESSLLVLEPLGADASRALLDARGQDLAPEVTERIVATAEGNPLFLEQLLAVGADDGPATLPPTIEAVLAARIDRLEQHEREVLRHASAEGRRFHARAVAELLPAEERVRMDRSLLGLVEKRLIQRTRTELAGEDAFRFTHALIRDAAYAGLPKRLRGEHHERLADWLRARHKVRDETVGFHLEQACRLRAELGPPDAHDRALAGEAADRLAAAAQAELRRGDAAAAARLLERALALLPPDDPARATLRVILGAVLVDAGRLADADQHLAAAIALAEEDGDPRTVARARVELELERQHAGRSAGGEAALRLTDAALAEFERHGDDLGRCRAWRLRAWTEWAASCAAAADAAWQQAADLARRAGDERELFEVLGWRASAAAFGPTPVTEAIDRCERFRAEAAGSPVAVAFVLHPLGLLHAMGGDFDRARALAAEADAILADLGRMAQAVSHHEAMIELLAGRPDAAEERLRDGYTALERMGEHAVLATTAADLARVVLEQGRHAEAATLCSASEELAAPEDVATQAMWRGVRARLLAADGEHDRAAALGTEAVALIEPTDLLNDRADVLLDLADVLRLGGRADEAGRIRERAVALYEQKGNRISAARARSWPAPREPA